MAQINPNIPIIGDPVATEDPKVKTALEDIVDEINGKLDNTNIAAAGVANINGAKLLDASVAAAKLTTDSVETAKIVNDAVTNDKIGDDAVDTAQIADDAVENAQIADDAVDTAQIADGAVETAQINDGAVTAAKIAASTTASVTFTNGASDGTPGVLARKYANGLVVLQGGFTKLTAAKDTGYVTLPADYRPPAVRHFAIASEETEQVVRATVNATGVITLDWNGANTPFAFYLDGIAFHAA